MNEIELIIFFISTLGITFFSWRSLKDRQSHGFFRFFAFELILLLILFNVDYWFADPFSVLQIISWILLIFSIVVVVDGFYLIKKIGRPVGIVKDSSNLGFENTSNLVTIRIYRFIRHPLYASLLFLGWGAFLKNLTVPGSVIIILISVFLTLTAEKEEKENKLHFGDEYSVYMSKTKMFIPFIF
jgi:protein-S-isoprenylcysteine O-methyltransferase Ste14